MAEPELELRPGPNSTRFARIATWNIRNGRAENLVKSLRAMDQMGIDLGLLTETKVTDGIHTRSFRGYRVVCTDAASAHQGGVALFYRNTRYWTVESVAKFGPNVMSWVLRTGRHKLGFVGCYIPPNDVDTLEYVERAMGSHPS